jgi:hypothetical protein
VLAHPRAGPKSARAFRRAWVDGATPPVPHGQHSPAHPSPPDWRTTMSLFRGRDTAHRAGDDHPQRRLHRARTVPGLPPTRPAATARSGNPHRRRRGRTYPQQQVRPHTRETSAAPSRPLTSGRWFTTPARWRKVIGHSPTPNTESTTSWQRPRPPSTTTATVSPTMSSTSTGGWPHLQTANDELDLPDHAARPKRSPNCRTHEIRSATGHHASGARPPLLGAPHSWSGRRRVCKPCRNVGDVVGLRIRYRIELIHPAPVDRRQ